MNPELLRWITNHRCDKYLLLAFDDAAQELYVQVESTLYIVGYQDLDPASSFDPSTFRRQVLAVGKVFDPIEPAQTGGRPLRLSA